MTYVLRRMTAMDVAGAVALQQVCFPPPFDPDLHWDAEHLLRHIELFPEGQFVAEHDQRFIVASCSNTIVGEESWQAHAGWGATVGGLFLKNFDRGGSTLYGLDISVHPNHRRRGIAKAFYQGRFNLVRRLKLQRYGTACRIPGWREWSIANGDADQIAYANSVGAGDFDDVTLTPLLKIGLTMLDVIYDYLPDEESGDAAVLLEWKP